MKKSVTKKLYEVADIQTGLVLSRKEADHGASTSCEYRRFTLKSLSDNGQFDGESFEVFFSSEELHGQVITQPGDIIIRTFVPPNPIVITREFSGIVVPSQLASIRVKDTNKVNPDFLRYYLSQESVWQRLAVGGTGTALRIIKVSELTKISIPIPSIEIQRDIVEITELTKRKKQLYEELSVQEDKLAKAIIQRLIKN